MKATVFNVFILKLHIKEIIIIIKGVISPCFRFFKSFLKNKYIIRQIKFIINFLETNTKNSLCYRNVVNSQYQ